MQLRFHRLVQEDLRVVLRYYETEGGPELADRFFAEMEATIVRILGNPQAFHRVKAGLRRANFERFPYHFLFREGTDLVRVLVLRHHRKHPDQGIERA